MLVRIHPENPNQKEIDKAIQQAEEAEQQSKEKDTVIDRLRKQISLLDRKANPQHYSLSSGANLVRINVSNYRNPSLHIWTRSERNFLRISNSR